MSYSDWATQVLSSTPSWYQNLTGQIAGKTGSAINTVGNWLGNPLPEGNVSENLQRIGGMLNPVKTAYASDAPTGGQSTYDPYAGSYSTGGTGGTTGGTSGTGGQVLGTQTQTGGDTGGGIDYGNILNSMKSSVGGAYDQVFSALDQLAGDIPNYVQQKTTDIGNLFGSQQGELQTVANQGQAQLPGYKQNVLSNQADSVKTLAENFRKALNAGNISLGTAGAGNSSAAGMYNFALSKEANKGRGDILKQTNQQLADIDKKGMDIQNTFQTQLGQLETWKTGELGKITDWVQQRKDDIAQQKIGATSAKAQALAQTETGIMQQAVTYLQGIESKATDWNSALKNWAIQRMGNLDDLKTQLGEMSKYTAPQIVQSEISALPAVAGGGAGQDWSQYNPYLSQLKKAKTDTSSLFNWSS